MIWRGRAATTRAPSSPFCHEGPWGRTACTAAPPRWRATTRRCWRRRGVDVLSSQATTTSTSVESGPTPRGTCSTSSPAAAARIYSPSCRASSGPPPNVPHPLPPCPASVAVLTNSYHYIMVEVAPDGVTLCPRHPDGSPVEACVHLPPQRGLVAEFALIALVRAPGSMYDVPASKLNPITPELREGRHVLAWDDVSFEVDPRAPGARVTTALRLGGRNASSPARRSTPATSARPSGPARRAPGAGRPCRRSTTTNTAPRSKRAPS